MFVLPVTEEAVDWPERDVRKREWVDPAEAVDRIEEPGLKEIIAAVCRPAVVSDLGRSSGDQHPLQEPTPRSMSFSRSSPVSRSMVSQPRYSTAASDADVAQPVDVPGPEGTSCAPG